MIPFVHLATATIPGGAALRLMRRGADFSIMLGATELMSSRLRGSEEALATMTIERLGDRPAAHLLVGGLGMGFTLRAALGRLGPGARVTVAELVPEVADWARGPMAALFGGCLADPRVGVEIVDVARPIAAARSAYDAILLDVDNGPDGLTASANDRLYDAAGLAAARAALRPGGILAVWSQGPDARFGARLRKAGFTVEECRVRADGRSKGARHVVWFATTPGSVAAPRGAAAGRMRS